MDKKMAYYIHVKLFMILVLGFSQYSILQTKSGLVKTVPKIANDSRNFEVIRLSTADDKFEMYKFRKRNFQQAVNAVKRYELEILRIREDIIRNYTKPHLNYGMLPYLPSAVSSIRSRQSSSDHLLWEKMTEAEVLCNRAKISVCTNLRSIKRMLKIMKKDLHKRRSKWYLSTNEQKTETPKLIKNLRRCNKELSKINSLIRHWYRQQRQNNNYKSNRQTRKQYRTTKGIKS
ncbi:hypothetical protein KUTeg_012493 [Tegillarca granosa]|uniref:Uncharacterized protein n=1 Tax=Tegillarca granosa TaxID=220873 RepID=A0ABQ9EZQ4_TEGGR|nr:hypothetical protein KUTeg_012493 [Tegillarca granosa]